MEHAPQLVVGNVGSDNRYTFRVASGTSDGTTFDNDVSGGNSWFDTNYPGISRGTDGTQRRSSLSLSLDGSNQIVVSQYCNVTLASCNNTPRTLSSSSGAQFFIGYSSYSAGYVISVDRLFVHQRAATGTFSATIL